MILKIIAIPFLFVVGALGIVTCATFELVNIFIINKNYE
jgi:hypothetical protein